MFEAINYGPADDGGWWQMFANLVNKYGLVPKSAYPESANSRNSDAFKQYLNTKLREFASDLRDRLDCDTVRVDQLFGTEFTFDKAKGLEYVDCLSNHAMTLTGVNLDEDGRPNRWKVVKACAQVADHADHNISHVRHKYNPPINWNYSAYSSATNSR